VVVVVEEVPKLLLDVELLVLDVDVPLDRPALFAVLLVV
jgi:hypothetical protein